MNIKHYPITNIAMLEILGNIKRGHPLGGIERMT